MITKTQLTNFSSGDYTQAIENWGTAADGMSSSAGTLSGIAEQMSSWTGAAADAANTSMAELISVIAGTSGGGGPGILSAAQDTLAAFVATVNAQKQALTTAVAQATRLQCTVGEDGTVTPPSQPPGEPPQVCYADPHQEAARQKAQTSYDNSPAVKSWQAATQEAPGLQTTIQQALQKATAADTRAAGDLHDGIKAASDVQTIMAGKDSDDVAGSDLFALDQKMNDGVAWVYSYIKQVSGLLPQAAGGDSAATSLLQALGPLAYDQDFSAGLMNQLGAKGLEQLPLDMGQKIQDETYGGSGSVDSTRTTDQGILSFLATSLASASNSGQLSGTFISGLKDNGTVTDKDEDDNPVGYWSLGQILGANNGAGQTTVTYDPTFLSTVGTSIISYEASQQKDSPGDGWETGGPFMNAFADNLNLANNADISNLPYYFGQIDVGANPVYGLMHAASTSPAAAQALFAPTNGNENPNLTTVLTVLPWSYDKGSALGAALQSATEGSGPTPALITSELVNTLASQYQHHSSYAGHMSGLNTSVATILARPGNMLAINDTMDEGSSSGPNSVFDYPNVTGGASGLGPGFSSTDLARVLGVVSQDKTAYATLQTGQVAYLQNQLDQAVAGGNPSIISQTLNQGMTTLTALAASHAAIAQDGANASAAKLQSELTRGSYITQGLSTAADFIPGGQVVGVPAGIAGTVIGDISGTVHASTAPTTAGDSQELSLTNYARIALAQALISNHAATPTTLPGNAPFTNAQGQLLPAQQLAHDPAALGSLSAWLQGQPVPGSSNYDQVVTGAVATGRSVATTNLGATGG